MNAPIYPSSEDVARVVRRCLDEGKVVEIDGLGTFRPRKDGSFDFLPDSQPRVFIAYADEECEKRIAFVRRSAAAGLQSMARQEKTDAWTELAARD